MLDEDAQSIRLSQSVSISMSRQGALLAQKGGRDNSKIGSGQEFPAYASTLSGEREIAET